MRLFNLCMIKSIFVNQYPSMSLDLVIIPTYNEIENVEAIIRAVVDLGQGYHISLSTTILLMEQQIR